MTAVDRSPTRLAGTLSLVAALVAVAVAGPYSWGTLALGLVGLVALAVAVLAGRQTAATLGGCAVFAGAVVAGLDGAPPLVVLVGAVAAILAWDAASTAIGIGDQLGRAAATGRLELVHVTATALVGGAGLAVAYGIYTAAAWNVPLTAGLLFCLAVVLMASALR